MKPFSPAAPVPVMIPLEGAEHNHDDQATLGGILICGGKSRRMGRDKALLEVDGRTLIARAAEVLGASGGPLLLACGPERRYTELGLPLALDPVIDGGPLAGICAGLAGLNSTHAMVLACDMPRVSPAIVERLFEVAQAEQLDVCYLATERGVEPLCAVYSRRCLPAIQSALSLGVRKVTSFLQETELGRALVVGQVPLSEFPANANAHCNVNTPEDLTRFQNLKGGPR